jgi:integrase
VDARVPLPAADLDPSGRARLSYQHAEALFSEASGATLHQLRHSALTHDAELGTGTPMLMARSGHTPVRSLATYARVSAEAPSGRARPGAAAIEPHQAALKILRRSSQAR